MIEQSKSCRCLLRSSHVSNEVGGDVFPTVMRNAIPNCEIDLLEYPTGMDWKKCEQTSVEGPCWQRRYSSMTLEEWNAFVKQRKRELGGK